MLHFLPSFLLGPLSLFLIILNIIATACFPFYVVSLLKRWTKDPKRHALYSRWLDQIVNCWHYVNDFILFMTQKIEWDVRGSEAIPDRSEWVFVLSNHRSWVDIFVLFHCLHRKSPFIKYFLKQQLRKVPIMGYCWEALDYPFLDRYTRQQLVEKPELMGQDLARIGRSCQKFNRYPVCIIAFPEGTRFSIEKHRKQEPPFQYLLKPRVGGVAMALTEMKENLKVLLDVTLFYDPETVSFWDLMAGKIRKITVSIKPLPFPMELAQQDYINDPGAREQYQRWLNEIWQGKEAAIEGMALTNTR